MGAGCHDHGTLDTQLSLQVRHSLDHQLHTIQPFRDFCFLEQECGNLAKLRSPCTHERWFERRQCGWAQVGLGEWHDFV